MMTETNSRRRACVIALASVALLTCASCRDDGASRRGAKIPEPARSALEKGTQFELLSLDPDFGPLSETRKSDERPKNPFHECDILGKTPIRDAAARTALVTALEKGADESDGAVASCFNPRHAIRAIVDGKTVDLVICFECSQAAVYVDGVERTGFATTSSPLATFDQVLRDSGVPLAAPAK